jgi:dual-specificity kinase
VLQKLKERDPSNRQFVSLSCHVFSAPPFDVTLFSKCIHLLNWFDYRNHICLVSELLGMCVYDFLKENDFAPFPRDHIQSFAQQLLGSVACTCFTSWWRDRLLMSCHLVLHDLHIIHTDLKPENILLVRNDSRTVTIPTPGKVPSQSFSNVKHNADQCS